MAANIDVLSFAFSFVVLIGGLIGYLKAGNYYVFLKRGFVLAFPNLIAQIKGAVIFYAGGRI